MMHVFQHMSRALGACIRQDELYFYCIKNGYNYDHTKSRGVDFDVPGVGGGGGVHKEDHNTMTSTGSGVSTIRDLRLNKAQYTTEPTFNDLGFVHRSITVAVIYADIFSPSPGGTPAATTRKYFLLGTRPLDVNYMLIVTERWLQELRDRKYRFNEISSLDNNVVLAEVQLRNSGVRSPPSNPPPHGPPRPSP